MIVFLQDQFAYVCICMCVRKKKREWEGGKDEKEIILGINTKMTQKRINTQS